MSGSLMNPRAKKSTRLQGLYTTWGNTKTWIEIFSTKICIFNMAYHQWKLLVSVHCNLYHHMLTNFIL